MGLADPIMRLADLNSRVIFGGRDRSDVSLQNIIAHIYHRFTCRGMKFYGVVDSYKEH